MSIAVFLTLCQGVFFSMQQRRITTIVILSSLLKVIQVNRKKSRMSPGSIELVKASEWSPKCRAVVLFESLYWKVTCGRDCIINTAGSRASSWCAKQPKNSRGTKLGGHTDSLLLKYVCKYTNNHYDFLLWFYFLECLWNTHPFDFDVCTTLWYDSYVKTFLLSKIQNQ